MTLYLYIYLYTHCINAQIDRYINTIMQHIYTHIYMCIHIYILIIYTNIGKKKLETLVKESKIKFSIPKLPEYEMGMTW